MKAKKFTAMLLVVIMVLSMSACGSGTDSGTNSADAEYEIVMLFDTLNASVNDGSFGEGTWDGISRYCDETGAKATYFTPAEESTEAYMNNIEQAVGVGAKYIVMPGYLFEEALFEAQDLYPDVNFIILDGQPHNADYTEYRTADNTYSIMFKEQEVGFLAGYAVVKEGFRNLAFFGGMGVTSVARFGYGYIEGAEYAAEELGLSKGDVELIYWYSGDFTPSPEKLTTVTGWYETGTEVIFSCGGSICDNAFAAAESLGKTVVGVDVNQADESDTCITSAMKGLSNAVYDALTADTFPGGIDATLGTEADCVGLPTDDDSWRFENFTLDDYNAIYEKLKTDENGLASGLYTDTDIDEPTEIPLEYVSLNYLN